jgi:methylated-DNA-protein-cysteine methyltransferase-like protein
MFVYSIVVVLYLYGEMKMSPGFTSPPDPMFFYAQVWEIVRQIPYGHVTTYGRIAAMIPPPQGIDPKNYKAFGARWVGGAMAACPDGVPWQRVVNAQGKISPRKGADLQRQLLEDEGVIFDQRERIDLKQYGWHAPQQEETQK